MALTFVIVGQQDTPIYEADLLPGPKEVRAWLPLLPCAQPPLHALLTALPS